MLSLCLSSSAQSQFAGWLGTFQNYKLNDKTGLYFDGQLRSTGQLEQVQALMIRPGINFYLTPRLTATVGYAYIYQQRRSGEVTGYLPEHRTWQQMVYTHPLHFSPAARATAVSHRLRLEQRFLPKHHVSGNTLTGNGHAYANRLRYFVRGVIPVSGQSGENQGTGGQGATAQSSGGKTGGSQRSFNQGFFAALQNELFVNVGDASAVNGKIFDQNRAFFAFGYRFSKQFDTEIGYMNQYVNGAGTSSSVNHILQLGTYLRL
ncbi:DUF2490 domain-containing protein [Flavitalea flava]